jgi:hypothetical protein
MRVMGCGGVGEASKDDDRTHRSAATWVGSESSDDILTGKV